ncbi:MAG: bifunctional diaminohydroxyphosphoribosylaminopyrimidine deaminase/5-amino-6-(5-phosphoribosylamino)uracil reductase RibD [Alkalimonas sp.]|nr:bifunctional diaminohydroxyphosphoribosylaminopyrimidine deaminase/5-amino-6-(5-phosphoribosylamino)uracil reductase RibD [Alkalimonas sp.]
MAQAIQLAAKGRYTTTPNPNVGCVMVKHDKVIGQGYHHQAGGPHAEVMALREAGEHSRGATCYVTLEPCSHFGRTPPCAQALIDAKVAKVVMAMQDPNPAVAGKGAKMLQAAGIEVVSGFMADAARALNPGFLTRMEQGRPLVRVKLAASLDGKTALANGKSQWISSGEARADVQHFRALSCAVLSTAETVLQDQARLTLRAEQANQPISPLHNGAFRQPVRVILDARQRLTGNEALFQQSGDILLVYPAGCTASAPGAARALYAERDQDGYFQLSSVFAALREYAFNSIWVEAGARLAGSLLQAGLVDELVLYQAAKLLGSDSRSLVDMAVLTDLSQAIELTWQDIRQLGPDLRIIAQPHVQGAY